MTHSLLSREAGATRLRRFRLQFFGLSHRRVREHVFGGSQARTPKPCPVLRSRAPLRLRSLSIAPLVGGLSRLGRLPSLVIWSQGPDLHRRSRGYEPRGMLLPHPAKLVPLSGRAGRGVGETAGRCTCRRLSGRVSANPESEGKYHERPGATPAGHLTTFRRVAGRPPIPWALSLWACVSAFHTALVNCFSTDRHRRHCWPSAHADFRRPVTRLATDRLMRGWHWRSSAVLNSLPVYGRNSD